MPWLKLTIASTREQLELHTAVLEQAGAQAVTIADAADEPIFDLVDGKLPTWQNNRVSGLFPDHLDETEIRQRLAEMDVTLEDSQAETTWKWDREKGRP